MRATCAIPILMPALALAGCASFNGQPEPVISVAFSDQVLAGYQVPAILKKYDDLQGVERRAYRDEVIAVYSQAIDARYFQFRSNLSAENKSTNLGFDSLLLGLAGAATLSPHGADEIAAVTAGALGLRSSVDKNVYFERTLPALFASMDAERYKVRSSMAQHMAQDTRQYPLAAALVELQQYQQAGTMLTAIAAVNQNAAQAANDAKKEYDRRVKFTCDSADDVNTAIFPVGQFTSNLIVDAENEESQGRTAALDRLRQTADAMGINGAATKNRQQLTDAIDDAMLNSFCTLDEVTALKKKLRESGLGFTAG